jgi:hypothetical protein
MCLSSWERISLLVTAADGTPHKRRASLSLAEPKQEHYFKRLKHQQVVQLLRSADLPAVMERACQSSDNPPRALLCVSGSHPFRSVPILSRCAHVIRHHKQCCCVVLLLLSTVVACRCPVVPPWSANTIRQASSPSLRCVLNNLLCMAQGCMFRGAIFVGSHPLRHQRFFCALANLQ